ncbi:hypothetical protein AB7Z32_40120 [Bradyrhizobium sp. 482_C4_N1_1]|uniref:hypothetical protein n=1 Tax=unclassified Bradyrhizobium TaxID=2631580 RepID=UPI003F88E110
MSVLYLERPSFWTDTRDGEAWFRALATLMRADPALCSGSPRAVWQHVLSKTLSRRTALGLFGAVTTSDGALLHGAGLMIKHGSKWQLHVDAADLVSRWERQSPGILTDFAEFLVRNSVWLRCLLCRLLDGDWVLKDWQQVRSRRRGITPGESLILKRFAEPEHWLEGLEQRSSARWLVQTGCSNLAVHPDVLRRASRRDDLSLSPLTAPLHLLETVGWITSQGALQLPVSLVADLTGQVTAANALTEITNRHADIRGLVAAELVLRELLATFGASPSGEDFSRWMDLLLETSVSTGALEILSAEPGQSRHGRGLFGDPSRKLVRWVVHPEFNDRFQSSWAALESNRTARHPALPRR